MLLSQEMVASKFPGLWNKRRTKALVLYELTINQLVSLLKDKKASSMEITKEYLERIKKLNPELGCFITVCEDLALEDARKCQDLIDRGESTSHLVGIPFAIKDNICSMNIKTTCASKMLNNFVPPYDATVCERLKEAGGVLLGKLNMDEFAMGSTNETSFFQKVKNPWDTKRVAGGSSGGSAAAVSSGLTAFSLGSDTGGSIRLPAAFCGVTGMKPTYGTVSRYGLVAFASSLDQIGPFARDIEDLALVMNVIAGHDPKDATSLNVEYPDYTKALKNDIKGMKIGVPREYIGEGINPEVKKSVLEALDTLESLGATWEECSLPMTEYAIPAYYLISSAEASSNLARYDGVKYGYRAEKFSDLMDLYCQTRSEGFGDEVKRRIMLGTYALSSGYYDAYYKKALQVRTIIKNEFDRVFDKYDLIIGPTAPTTAYKFGEKSDNPMEMYLGDIYTVSVNIAGLPGLVVPCGFDAKKLPIGLQLIGKALDEPTLIRVAYTFQQNTEFHKLKPGL